MTTELQKMSLWQILRDWRPGSGDWNWWAEAHDLKTRDKDRTDRLREAIFHKGFSLADDTAPIQLGNDGRVWNGHHRLVIAMELKPEWLMVEVVGPDAREHDKE